MSLHYLFYEQLEQINREALDLASQRLTEMVASAKSSPDMTRYLSTDLFLKANMAMMSGDHVTAAMLFTHVNELVPTDSFVAKKLAVNLGRYNFNKIIFFFYSFYFF